MAALKALEYARLNPCILHLKNGRSLYYNEYGAKNGFPIIYFHGMFSSRLQSAKHFHDFGTKYNLKLICTDRPGVGLSTIDPNITYKSYSSDIEELLNHLNIQPGQFGFCGISQGGSYVYSNLYFLKHWKPKIAALISAPGPYTTTEFDQEEIRKIASNPQRVLATTKPALFILQQKMFEYLFFYAPKVFEKILPKMLGSSKADQNMLNDASEEQIKLIIEDNKYSLHKYGTKGWRKVISIMYHDWGIKLKDIDAQQTKIVGYHGDDDVLVPVEWQQIPANYLNYKVRIFHNCGHIMIMDEMVANQIFEDIAHNIYNNS